MVRPTFRIRDLPDGTRPSLLAPFLPGGDGAVGFRFPLTIDPEKFDWRLAAVGEDPERAGGHARPGHGPDHVGLEQHPLQGAGHHQPQAGVAHGRIHDHLAHGGTDALRLLRQAEVVEHHGGSLPQVGVMGVGGQQAHG